MTIRQSRRPKRLALKGNGKGAPAATEYENEKGEIEKAELKLEFGGIKSKAALEVGEELDLNANKSLTISG